MSAGGGAPTRRGHRDPSLLVAASEPKDAALTNVFVCGDKPLPMGDLVLVRGVEVPGAVSWPRRESWVSARRIREVRAGDFFISLEQYRTGLELAQQIADSQRSLQLAADVELTDADLDPALDPEDTDTEE